MRSKSPAKVGKSRGSKASAAIQQRRQLVSWLLALLATLAIGFLFYRSLGNQSRNRKLLPIFRSGKKIDSKSAGLLQQITFFGIPEVDAALGCPAATHGCFYQFVEGSAPLEASGKTQPAEAACHAVLSNCNRHGECIKRRDWCLRRGGVPPWLTTRYPRRKWATEDRPAYLFGRPDLDNPTHLACLHFLPLMKWLRVADIPPGQVLMLWDAAPSVGPGKYGMGLAAALGETRWLPRLEGPVTFSAMRFGEYGDLRFPYHLKKHEAALAEDADFQRLAALVKTRLGLNPDAPARHPKVVIARRRHTRVLSNADELRAALVAAGMDATFVDFATLSFEQQVRMVAEAAVLVSVHGADCMNLMWLPPRAAILEIAPVHYGYGRRTVMRKGDYFNIARLLGKTHLEYVARSNATIIRNAQGDLVDWNHVNFVGEVAVDIKTLLPVVEAAVMAACGACYEPCGTTNDAGEENCVPEELLPRPGAT